MADCSITYGSDTLPTNHTIHHSLPVYRVFHVSPLSSATTYWLHLSCSDQAGLSYSSNTVTFTTPAPATSSAMLPARHRQVMLTMDKTNMGVLHTRHNQGRDPHLAMGKILNLST